MLIMQVPLSAAVARSVRGLVCVRGNSTAAATQEKPSDWDSAKPFYNIPGPKPLPIIGNTWRFMPGIGSWEKMDFAQMNEMLYKDYGKISRFGGIPGRRDIIMLFDPVDVEKVFRNEGVWPARTGLESFVHYRTVTRKDFFESAGGLMSTQGEEWGKFRTTVNQPMMQPRVARSYVAPIDDVARDFVNRIPMLRDANGEMLPDFINELYKWALESIAMIALDTRLGCLEATLHPDSEPQQMINNVHVIFECMFNLEFRTIPVWKLINTPTWNRYVKSSDYIRETGMKYVNIALERLKTMPPDSQRELSILERILARDPNPKVACVMAVDMMMAGIDTTSHAVGFLLYFLATHPEKQKKLHEEINRILSRTNGRITDENINDFKYLKACSKESMRMSPVVAMNTRTTNKDLVLQGYQVPKGTDVLMIHKTMSMLHEHFPNSDQFIPERWLKNDPGGNQATHPFAMLPFGFGVRMCVGRRFAELEIATMVARILQKHRVEWNYGPMQSESKLLTTCKSPLRYKMIDRV